LPSKCADTGRKWLRHAQETAVSFRLIKLIDAALRVRVGEQGEIEGLDLSQHGERGYNL
jgi:ammonia channel protein AmtB